MDHDFYFTMNTHAFESDGPRVAHRICVEKDGRVLVWDSVAGFFTSTHCMSERSMQAARRLAKRGGHA